MIVIVDYQMGNVGSIVNMFKRLGVPAKRSESAEDIEQAERLILPGVGAFDKGMDNLQKTGLAELLNKRVTEAGIPILGICLGMQLMTQSSEEGKSEGLGWLEAKTVDIKADAPESAQKLRVPHIGWNFVDVTREHPIFEDLPEDPRYYFVHSYKVVCDDEKDIATRTSYGDIEFTSSFVKKNIAGVQYHPEKSHKFGMKLLSNFAKWDLGNDNA